MHSFIQHVHHNSLNIKYDCRNEVVKNTYLIKNSSRNQLRRCNVPPNHRLVCSLISQRRCHPQAGHDSPMNKELSRLTHSQRYTNQPSQCSWVYQAIKELGKDKFYAGELIEELRAPTPELAWLLGCPHMPNIRKSSPSLLHSPSGPDLPSSAIQGLWRKNPTI